MGNIKAVTMALFLSVAATVAVSTLIRLIPLLNLKSGGDFVWYPYPTSAIAIWIVWGIHKKVQAARTDSASGSTSAPHTCILVLSLVVVTAAIALYLTGWEHIRNGTAALRGDALSVNNVSFKAVYSVLLPLLAGVTEEATIRGLLQLRVAPLIGSVFAQVLASLVFLLLHGATIARPNQLAFLIVLAVLAGYLTSRSKSILPAAMFHGAVNLSVATTVLLNRSLGSV